MEPDERQRLARAAWAYSKLEMSELAGKTGIKPGTIRGYLSRDERRAPGPREARLIVEAAGFPPDLIGPDPESSDDDIHRIDSELRDLRDAVAKLAADNLRLHGELRSLLSADRPGRGEVAPPQ